MKSLATFMLLVCIFAMATCTYTGDFSDDRGFRGSKTVVSLGSKGGFHGDDGRRGFRTGGRAFSSGTGKFDDGHGLRKSGRLSGSFLGRRRFGGDFDKDGFGRDDKFGRSFGRRGGFRSDNVHDFGKPRHDVVIKNKIVPGPVHGSLPLPGAGPCPYGVKYYDDCYAEPCSTVRCSKYPRARCQNDYCGGCNAKWIVDWYGNERDVTKWCY